MRARERGIQQEVTSAPLSLLLQLCESRNHSRCLSASLLNVVFARCSRESAEEVKENHHKTSSSFVLNMHILSSTTQMDAPVSGHQQV